MAGAFHVTQDGGCLFAETLSRFERSLEGVLSAGAVRRRAVEPVEERQLLWMISEAAVVYEERLSRQWIADFQIILTVLHLADVTPRRSRVPAERIVEQLAEFVRPRVNVFDVTPKIPWST